MARFLVDEDLPRSLARRLRSAGIHADDSRDVGLRGHADEEILSYATSHALILLTADLGFGNLLRFPLGSHAGVLVARFPNDIPTITLDEAILSAIQSLSDQEISGNLTIIEPGRVRLRRKS